MNRYPIAKQTATHADTLAAIGAADLLRHLEPHIVEMEDCFEILLPRALRRSDIEAADPGFSYLLRPGRRAPSIPPERVIELGSTDGLAATAPGAARHDRMYTVLSRMKAYAGP